MKEWVRPDRSGPGRILIDLIAAHQDELRAAAQLRAHAEHVPYPQAGHILRELAAVEERRRMVERAVEKLDSRGREIYRLRFIEQHGSYIISYPIGRRLVRDYINRRGGATDPAKRWQLFRNLLTTPQTPSNLAREPG